DKHGRTSHPRHDERTATQNAAILLGRTAPDVITNGRGERQTRAAIEICFNAARAASWCRIEMDTHENRVSIRIRDRHSPAQGNKYVRAPRHYNVIAIS